MEWHGETIDFYWMSVENWFALAVYIL